MIFFSLFIRAILEPGESTYMNTYLGHIFSANRVSDKETVDFMVVGGQEYELSPFNRLETCEGTDSLIYLYTSIFIHIYTYVNIHIYIYMYAFCIHICIYLYISMNVYCTRIDFMVVHGQGYDLLNFNRLETCEGKRYYCDRCLYLTEELMLLNLPYFCFVSLSFELH
jgi:hypothetical protein